MKSTVLSFLVCVFAATVAHSQTHPEYRSLDEMRRAARPVSEAAAVPRSPRVSAVYVGDPSSSLTKAQAVSFAQDMAMKIPRGAVCDISKSYDRALAPLIPANAVLVIEPATFADIRAFDVILYLDPAGEIRARRLLSKSAEYGYVGFEKGDIAPSAIAPEAFIGRVVAQILFDPATDHGPLRVKQNPLGASAP